MTTLSILGIDWFEFQNYVGLWVPILLMGVLVYLIWRTLKLMPRTKPQQITPRSASSVDLGRHPGCRGDQGRAARGGRVPEAAEAVQAARRNGAEGHPAARPARHRQDPARQGRRSRVGRQLLRPVGLLVRGDVRRPRSRADPATVQAGPRECPGDRLHRRARRGRRPSRLGHLGGARPDAEPAPGRDGRLRLPRQRDRDGRVEHAREARPRAAAPGALRPPGLRAAAGHARARADPRRAHAEQAAGPRRGPGADGASHRRADGRGPGQPLPTRRRSWPVATTATESPKPTSRTPSNAWSPACNPGR